jgi:hypothetical protein
VPANLALFAANKEVDGVFVPCNEGIEQLMCKEAGRNMEKGWDEIVPVRMMFDLQIVKWRVHLPRVHERSMIEYANNGNKEAIVEALANLGPWSLGGGGDKSS